MSGFATLLQCLHPLSLRKSGGIYVATEMRGIIYCEHGGTHGE